MPNEITSSGIVIQTRDEIRDEILNGAPGFLGMRQIYGEDINVEPNSPDGQMLEIFTQAKVDMLEFIRQVFSSFDPDEAVGINLDRRVAINGIQRAAGTYTQQAVEVTVDRPITLPGLDSDPDAPFTVQDSAGNQFQLISSYSFPGPGTAALAFQAKDIGAVETTPNTITQVVTIVLGVVSVNNPAAATSVGVNEESDFDLRIRRARSVAIPSRGYLDGLIGALLDLDGVTEANVFENTTNTTDSNGIPGHSIWVIVAGGDADEIGNVIYVKRNAGCGMKGSTSVTIQQIDGTEFEVLFDRPIPENLYIKFDVEAITGSVDVEYLREQLFSKLKYNIAQSADTASIIALIKEIMPNASVSNEGVSNDGVYYNTLLPVSSIQNQFTVAEIEINGTIS